MPAVSPKILESLRGPILTILRQSDLSSISAKKVRIALQNTPADAMQGGVGSDAAGPRLLARMGIDLEDKAHKKAVDEMIKECFEAISTGAEPSSRAGGITYTNGGTATTMTPKLALPGMGGVRGTQSDAWPSSSANSSSSTPISKKRSRAVEDVDSEEENVDRETIKSIAAKQAKAKPAKKRKAKVNDDGTEKEKRPPNPNNPFNRPVILSDEMSQVCGAKEMPRYMITKQLWAYIKSKDLQNPSNKRQILCDPTLHKIFGKSEVDSFEMAKLISPHVTKKDHVPVPIPEAVQ